MLVHVSIGVILCVLLTRFYHNVSVSAAPEGSGTTEARSAEAWTSKAGTAGIRVDVASWNRCFRLGEVVARYVHDVLPVDVHDRVDERYLTLGEGVVEAVCRRADNRPACLAAAAMSMVMMLHVSPHGKHLLSFLITCVTFAGKWTRVTSRSGFAEYRKGNSRRRKEIAGRRHLT